MADDVQRPAKRSLLVTIAALLLAAIAFWGASRLAWFEMTADRRPAVELTGADVAGWLVPVAVLVLAAVAAVLALPGVVRRVLAVGLVAGGVVAVWFSLDVGAYETGWFAYQPLSEAHSDPERTFAGPAAAIAGAVLLLTAGALLLLRGHRMPRLGAKYSAPGGKPPAKDSDADLWRALSDGEDPTSGP